MTHATPTHSDLPESVLDPLQRVKGINMPYPPPTKADLCRAATRMVTLADKATEEDLRQGEWPEARDISSVRWNDDHTTLIFELRSSEQILLKVREPAPVVDLTDTARHIDLTVAERVDAVLSARMR